MTSQTLRYGIIGCGSMGREHIASITALGGEVAAIVSTHAPSRDAALALLPRAPRVFEQHQALLESGLCDAVVIATPNFTHIEMMRCALEIDGLHILVEKPLVTRMQDGVELLRRAAGRKGMVWVGQEYRYIPPLAQMIRMVRAGAAGRLHQVAIREHREPFYSKVGDWNRFSENTGGTLLEKCCHHFNLMDHILDEKPVRVFASGGQRVNHLDEEYHGRRPDILDSAYVIVEYGSGARAMLDLCMYAENSLDNEHIVAVGDAGKIEVLIPALDLRYGRRADWGRRQEWGQPAGTGKGMSVQRVWDDSIQHRGQHHGATYLQHQRFAAAIACGAPAEIPLEEGLRSVATGLAAHRSIDTGLPVLLSDILPAGW